MESEAGRYKVGSCKHEFLKYQMGFMLGNLIFNLIMEAALAFYHCKSNIMKLASHGILFAVSLLTLLIFGHRLYKFNMNKYSRTNILITFFGYVLYIIVVIGYYVAAYFDALCFFNNSQKSPAIFILMTMHLIYILLGFFAYFLVYRDLKKLGF